MDKLNTIGHVHSLGEIVSYEPSAIVTRSLLKKPTGAINLISYDKGVKLSGTAYPFDTFLLLLEGSAIITLDHKDSAIHSFQGIVIPANHTFIVTAQEQFKMLTVVIKSGYE